MRPDAGTWKRAAGTGLLGAVILGAFWASRPEWAAEMRLWRAVGDASLVLLVLALAVGPVARLRPSAARLVPWRRFLGIWFALLAALHAVLVWDGWARWDVLRLLGYEFIPELGRLVRLEPGFGLANLVGLTALAWALVLLAISSDRVLRRLGASTWKLLQNSAYVIFYLATLHTAYFLFLHYTLSFHREVPPANWFRWPFLLLAGAVVALQAAAMAKTVRARRGGKPTADEGAG